LLSASKNVIFVKWIFKGQMVNEYLEHHRNQYDNNNGIFIVE